MTNKENRYGRRTIALFWCAVVAIVIGVIIYLEQIAVLSVLATLALIGLLLVVGFSDLESVDRDEVEGFKTKGS